MTKDVTACRECDSTNITPRPRSGGWRCKDCMATFQRPVERKAEGFGSVNGLARRLERMDADELEGLCDES